jgi:hypothetical protein
VLDVYPSCLSLVSYVEILHMEVLCESARGALNADFELLCYLVVLVKRCRCHVSVCLDEVVCSLYARDDVVYANERGSLSRERDPPVWLLRSGWTANAVSTHQWIMLWVDAYSVSPRDGFCFRYCRTWHSLPQSSLSGSFTRVVREMMVALQSHWERATRKRR